MHLLWRLSWMSPMPVTDERERLRWAPPPSAASAATTPRSGLALCVQLQMQRPSPPDLLPPMEEPVSYEDVLLPATSSTMYSYF